MAMRDEVLDVLNSAAVRRISFSFSTLHGGTVSVNAMTFQRVADAINAGRVAVAEERRAGQGGMYDAFPADTTLSGELTARQTRNRRKERAYVVHESVHASFDLTRTQNFAEIENEAACFLAQFLFLRHAGVTREDAFNSRRGNAEIYTAIWNATSTVVSGGIVPERHMTAVRNQLQRHPFYRGQFLASCAEDSRGCYLAVTFDG